MDTLNIDTKSQLAKLIATENITVQQNNVKTASFDVVNRVLTLPIFKTEVAIAGTLAVALLERYKFLLESATNPICPGFSDELSGAIETETTLASPEVIPLKNAGLMNGGVCGELLFMKSKPSTLNIWLFFDKAPVLR